MDPQTIVAFLTPILVPLLISGVKKLIPKLPVWSLPVMAPFLGAAFDVIMHFATGSGMNVWAAAGLGLAGVGVREIKDQLMKPPAAVPATPL
jgi:hypothetical protein